MKMIVAILVHGWNVVNPENGINKFRPHFEQHGCMVETFTYGFVPLTWQLIKRNPALAKRLAGRCKHWADLGYTVIICCHSNGAAITRLACVVHGADVRRVVAMHPALDPELDIAPGAELVLVAHNQGDHAVVVGSMLQKLFSWLAPKRYQARPWGQMGQDGYQGQSPNVMNFDTGSKAGGWKILASGHSDEFSDKKQNYFLGFFTLHALRGL